MKYSAVIGAALCASAALAAPSPAAPVRRLASHSKKFAGNTGRVQKVNSNSGMADAAANGDSLNWSGGTLTAESGDVLTSVAALISVPTPSPPGGATAQTYSGAAWVGIDGTESNAGLWQAGIAWDVDNSQSPPAVTVGAWTYWLNPDGGLVTVPNFTINPGDTIQVNLSSTSPSTGSVILAANGVTTTLTSSAPNPTSTLTGQTVEWITEDLESNGGFLPFANYGTVSYTDCYHDSHFGPGDAGGSSLGNIQQSTGTLSTATQPNSGEIDTAYTGP